MNMATTFRNDTDGNDVEDVAVSTIDPILVSTKRVVFVGGLPQGTTVAMIRAATIPFGNIQSIDMPMDYVKGIHRGFAFVEYESVDDADEAIYNLDGSELLGQTISVSVAQPNQIHRMTSEHANVTGNNEAIWTSDEWFQKQISGGDSTSKEDLSKRDIQQEDVKTLQRV